MEIRSVCKDIQRLRRMRSISRKWRRSDGGDIRRLHDLIREVAPGLELTMEYEMMGYGKVAYRYASGREGEWFKIGVVNNKQYISLYCCAADSGGYVAERYRERLPGAKIGKSCVRFRSLQNINIEILKELIWETASMEFNSQIT